MTTSPGAMTSESTAIAATADGGLSITTVDDGGTTMLRAAWRAMACDVRATLVDPGPDAAAALASAAEIVARVESACTRFDPTSPLMRANAAGRHWQQVPPECLDALAAAEAAHRETRGLFDPRVLERLVADGYDRSLPFADGAVEREGSGRDPRRPRRRWHPRLDHDRGRVRIGRTPVDLGGIGKGLAVRWAARPLRTSASAVLLEAGGDVLALGRGPEGTGWRLAVENPVGGESPIAVLALRDRAVATSSTRVRRWSVQGRRVHHLIDPRTGQSASGGLLAVTVVDRDPARAEVWSKALFVAGHDRIAALRAERDLAALWIQDDGRVRISRRLQPLVQWQVHRVR